MMLTNSELSNLGRTIDSLLQEPSALIEKKAILRTYIAQVFASIKREIVHLLQVDGEMMGLIGATNMTLRMIDGLNVSQ